MTLINPGILTLQEFMSQEPLPLATLQQAILAFLQGKDDVVIFGAQAVNAYVSEARMTQDTEQLLASNAPPEALTLWQTLVAQEIELADEDTDF